MASSLTGAAAFEPFVDFFLLEFPEAADPVGGHVLFVYLLVGSITLDPKIFRYFIDRKPQVFHALIPCVLIAENLV
jgi:hypothetical protein